MNYIKDIIRKIKIKNLPIEVKGELRKYNHTPIEVLSKKVTKTIKGHCEYLWWNYYKEQYKIRTDKYIIEIIYLWDTHEDSKPSAFISKVISD